MFELTDRARRALELAEEAARQLGHNFVGTEHILLGLIRADGMAAEVLTALGVSYESASAQVTDKERHGSSEASGNRPNQSSSPSWVEQGPELEQAQQRHRANALPGMPVGPRFPPTLTSPIDVTGNGSYTVTGGPVPLSPDTKINPGVSFPRDIRQYFSFHVQVPTGIPHLVTSGGETYVQVSFVVTDFQATYSGLRLWIA